MTTEQRFERMEAILERMVDRQEQFDDALTTLTESQINLTEAQAKTDLQIKAIGLAMEQLQQQTAALERQWQAYINTIRPQ